MFAWLKKYMPRGLYGRVLLILLLPVIGVQFIVSVVFIQRHFEDVTRQMTTSLTGELRYLVDEIATAPEEDERLRAMAGALGFDLRRSGEAGADRVEWFDLSGRIVADQFRAALPELLAVDLCGGEVPCQPRRVRVWLAAGDALWQMDFGRDRVSASNPHQLLVIMALFGIFLTLISFFYLRNQLRPIADLARAATAYGRGDLVPYRLRGATEVRAAGAAFLDMRARIERQGQARRLMLSGISHDLRSPLARMRLELAMLPEAESAGMLRDVEDMQKMLDAFLDYSRDESEDRPQNCDPAALFNETIAAAERAGMPIRRGACDAPRAEVRLRPVALRRALDNLIGNAARYGTTVRLSLRSTSKVLRFTVEDDGPGIPAAAREEAVRPFMRLDPARNQDQGSGVGLGLAIVSDVARRHGGRLDLGESADLGGLSATLVLPR